MWLGYNVMFINYHPNKNTTMANTDSVAEIGRRVAIDSEKTSQNSMNWSLNTILVLYPSSFLPFT